MKRVKQFIAVLTLLIMVSLGIQNPAPAEAAPQYKIEVNKRTHLLYLYKGDKVTDVFSVAVGKKGSPTPEGTFAIITKFKCPQWKQVPGCTSRNPLGKYFMGIKVSPKDQGRIYGIHGNNNPASIGKSTTLGCVRMNNPAIEYIFNKVPKGTLVWIHSGTSNRKWRGKSVAQYRSVPSDTTNKKLDHAKI
ncbi:L,D-transpeptidase [Thermoflavimicrobium daqui]|uniref:L,D-transpeptidase n=1 Tax=Thermoflavimicrobium daqui TaxID=2137476 RepID=A0A364K770_9BACL|nr:L,D-transpeptidase [Thermoflavimicrobium daqui]RAL26151.1 L,D-transpeptidase [Thermoflavimicrobium daqui]